MSFGGGVFLIVVGAILAFALNFQVAGIDMHLIGYILMAAGAFITILGIVLLTRRRSVVSTSRTAVDPVSGEQATRRATEDNDPRHYVPALGGLAFACHLSPGSATPRGALWAAAEDDGVAHPFRFSNALRLPKHRVSLTDADSRVAWAAYAARRSPSRCLS